jgi:hypothetical protein
MFQVPIVACTPSVLTEVFRDIPQCLEANARRVLELGRSGFLPHPFCLLFTVHPIIWRCTARDIDSVVT